MAQAATANNPERTNRLIAIGAVLFAALAAVLLFVALQSRDGGGGGAIAGTQDVVVAKQDIGVNSTLTAGMVEVKALPSDQVIAGAYGTAQGVLGLPVRYPLQKGEQITLTKIGVSKIQDEKDISYVLKPGQRAFAVSADEVSAVGGLLLPGNNVDVIAVFKNLDDQTGNARAYTVLQNITVLSVAQEAQEPVPAAATPVGDSTDQPSQGITGQRPSDVERQPGARSVTLALAPDQVQLLAALQDDSDISIWLSMRAVDDSAGIELPPTDLLPFVQP
jgi:pilus assembly protein CpaB